MRTIHYAIAGSYGSRANGDCLAVFVTRCDLATGRDAFNAHGLEGAEITCEECKTRLGENTVTNLRVHVFVNGEDARAS